MKRITLFIIVGLWAVLYSSAATVSYVGCNPESGSEVSSFNFTLTFDVEDAIADLGEGSWGLGYTGTADKCTCLYEGTPEEGILLSTIMTSNFTGKSDGFEVNGNTIDINFPLSVRPEAGKRYTLVVKNSFMIYKSQSSIGKTATKLEFIDSPLILPFIGKSDTSLDLILQSCSLSSGDVLEGLAEIRLKYNESISLPKDKLKVIVYEGNEIIAESSNVIIDPEDNTQAVVQFSNLLLYNQHSYKISIPKGLVVLEDDSNVENKPYEVVVSGSNYRYFTASSCEPENESKGLFHTLKISFDLPEGTDLMGSGDQSKSFPLECFNANSDAETLVCTIYGSVLEDGFSVEFPLDNLSPKPLSEYFLRINKGTIRLFDIGGYSKNDWQNSEFNFHFTTPSAEEVGILPIEVEAFVGKQNAGGVPFNDNLKYANLGIIDIAVKDLAYEYNGKTYKSLCALPEYEGQYSAGLYEITDQGDVLLKNLMLATPQRETDEFYYTNLSVSVNATLFQGKKYHIVIPAGVAAIASRFYKNYMTIPELSYVVEGSTPTEVVPISCTLEEGDEITELYNIVWEFNGQFDLVTDAKAKGVYKYGATINAEWPLSVYQVGENTYLSAHTYNKMTGNPITFKDESPLTVTLPAGILTYPSDTSLTNEEITVTAVGKKAVTVTPADPVEYVTVTVQVKESRITTESQIESVPTIHSYTIDAVRGKKFTLNLSEGIWKVNSLYRDGNDVLGMIDDEGIYTTPALNANTVISASLEPKDNNYVTVSQTTGVREIPETTYSVAIDNGNITISGLNGGENVRVYNMAGIVLSNMVISQENDSVSIGVPNGQYIVVINNTSVKVIL